MPLSDQNTRGRARTARRAVVPALLIAVLTMVLASCASSPKKKSSDSNSPSSSSSASSSTPSASNTSKTADPNAKTVKVTALQGDGETYGVGMPVVLKFSPTPTDISQFNKVVKVTVNGAAANGAWYWEQPYAGEPVEAHYRLQHYWPAHATIKVDMPIGGLYAGKGLKFSGALASISFATGDTHISTVDAHGLKMTVTSNGQVVRTVPVSLGTAQTPTYNGIKIVMQKGEDIPGTNKLRPNGTVLMSGPGYSGDPVPWSVRVTASGEYVHAAGWNTNIGVRSTSNGCTNLKPADGQWFYNFSRVGDVVQYAGTAGTRVPSWDGFGDWNVLWGSWTQGGPKQPATS